MCNRIKKLKKFYKTKFDLINIKRIICFKTIAVIDTHTHITANSFFKHPRESQIPTTKTAARKENYLVDYSITDVTQLLI